MSELFTFVHVLCVAAGDGSGFVVDVVHGVRAFCACGIMSCVHSFCVASVEYEVITLFAYMFFGSFLQCVFLFCLGLVFLVSVSILYEPKQQRTSDVLVSVCEFSFICACICRLLPPRAARLLYCRSCLPQNEKRDELYEEEVRSADTHDINRNSRRDTRLVPVFKDRDAMREE